MYSLHILLLVNFALIFSIKGSLSFTIPNTSLENENKNDFSIMSRIIFGEKVEDIRDYPFFAFLGNCGGAILNKRWIITAAHCLTDYEKSSNITVSVGSEGEKGSQKYVAAKHFVHQQYYEKDVANHSDIGLIKLEKDLKFSSKVNSIKLPEMRFRNGWMDLVARGTDETNNVSAVVKTAKLYAFNDGWNCGIFTNSEKSFCAHRDGFHAGTCFGDSGSPLVRRNHLIGIAKSITNTNCLESRFTTFTNVAYFLPWIQEVMEMN